jgi:hypothetical protein
MGRCCLICTGAGGDSFGTSTLASTTSGAADPAPGFAVDEPGIAPRRCAIM